MTNQSGNSSSYHGDFETKWSKLFNAMANDQHAWHWIFATYSPLIRFWCSQNGVRSSDVYDVCQEVFIKVARYLNCFRKSNPDDTFRGWLRIITRRTVCDHFRMQNKGDVLDAYGGSSHRDAIFAAADDPESSDSHLQVQNEDFILAAKIEEAIKKEFSDTYFRTFVDVVINQRKPSVVAEENKMTVNNVYKVKFRVLAKIRKLFPDHL